MSRRILASGLLGAALLGVGAARMGPEVAAQAANDAVMSPAAGLTWTTNERGVSFAHAWGDASVGPHGLFVRFPAGYGSPLHVHTADYHGVVITGTVVNPMDDASAGPDLRPGSYWFVPGGRKHVTRCVSATECVIYVHQREKFDFVPVR
jgi:hypothetical protein